MNRYNYVIRTPIRYRVITVGWDTWGELCDFIKPPIFKRGVYLDDLDNELEQPTGRDGEMGVLLNGPDGDVLVKQGENIFWSAGVYQIAKPDGGFIKIHE